jgi:UDP-3-O-[3-hydroxymyristoyl] glucosamine N-acyltransferase
MTFTASKLAELVKGEVVGAPETPISGLAAVDTAGPGDLTFADQESYFQAAEKGPAAAILAGPKAASNTKVLIRVANPRVAIARLLPVFFPPEIPEPGIHPTASIHPTAIVHPTACLGPSVVVGPEAEIGARSVLMGGNHIGRGARLGEDVCLYPNVVIYARSRIGNRVAIHAGTVIGSDGYGYVFDEGKHRKVLQVGNVVIEDDVEIGANTAIDRGALGSTVIGQGTKVDNLVHVAHNVKIGRHCLIMGQVGFAGSTTLGDYCVVASQSGIAGHLHLGHQAVVGAKSGVMRDVPDKGRVLGIPAHPDIETKRQWIGLQQLPDMLKRMREMEKELALLKAALPSANPGDAH